MSPVIVVVSADRSAVDALGSLLEVEGWAWEATPDVAVALEQALPGASLVALDIGLGDAALDFCREVRSRSNVALLVFAGDDREHDFVPFLEAGADDFLPRPERPRELIARMRALLRRVPVARPTMRVLRDAPIVAGDVSLDPHRHCVTVRGIELQMTLRQFELLHLFLTHPNQVLPRATILERVWGSDRSPTSNSLEVQIMRLRRWVEADPTAPKVITTVRGIGYRYVVS